MKQTMKLKYSLLYWCIILFLFSCQKNEDLQKISSAESLIKSSPDSAQLILESIDFPEELSEKDYSNYLLLIVSAHKKNKISIKEDTLIFKAVDYFRRTNDSRKLAKATLFAGRVHEERGEYGKAKQFYLDSYNYSGQLKDYKLRGSSAYELGELYEELDNYNEAINWFLYAKDAYKKSGSAFHQMNALRKIADCNVLMNELDSAVVLYQQLLTLIPDEEKAFRSSVYKNIALAYSTYRKYDKAIENIKKSIEVSPNDKLYPIQYLTLSELFRHKQNIDSAYYYNTLFLRNAVKQNDLKSIYAVYENLQQDKLDAFFKQQSRYKLHRTGMDSISQKQKYEPLKYLNNLYQQEKMKSRYKSSQIRNQQIFFISINLFLLISIFFYYYYQRKRKYIEKILLGVKKKDEIIDLAKIVLGHKLDTYKKMMFLSISPQKSKYESFLNDYNRILFGKEESFLIDWGVILSLVNSIYNDYSIKLSKKYSQLNDIEKKTCILLKIGFSFTEIAGILDKSIHTIYKYSSIIRKKLSIPEDENIIEFIDENVN